MIPHPSVAVVHGADGHRSGSRGPDPKRVRGGIHARMRARRGLVPSPRAGSRRRGPSRLGRIMPIMPIMPVKGGARREERLPCRDPRDVSAPRTQAIYEGVSRETTPTARGCKRPPKPRR